MQPNRSNQSGLANPALNPSAFERAIAQAPAAERTGMTALGANAKSGFLLVLAIAAGVFGWSEVDVMTVNGQQVGLQPSWTWLAFLLTFIFCIAGVFAVRSLRIIGPLYELSEGALLGIASHYFNLM
jgi:Bax inhibitor 1 like